MNFNAPLKTVMLFALLAPVLLAGNLTLRFLRWRLLLRGTGVNVGERLSLRVYLSSFAFNFTPLYLGPTIYRVLAMMRACDEPAVGRRVLAVAVAEVVHDAAGVAIVGFGAALFHFQVTGSAWALGLAAVIILLPPFRQILIVGYSVLINAVVKIVFRRTTALPAGLVGNVFSGPRFFAAVFLSVLAWMIPPLLLFALDQSQGRNYSLAVAVRAVSEASLFGPLSASPGGAGIADTVLHHRLEALGAAPSVASIFLYRLGTYWLATIAGAGVLLASFFGRKDAPSHRQHFEEIASVYDAQIPRAVRQRLLERKTAMMLERLPRRHLRGLDLGCGQGHYAGAMAGSGYEMIGVDGSLQQLGAASNQINALAAADAVHLPFLNESFDFVYSINVLHHLPSREAQAAAFAEIKRVLKPDGIFFLHEMNTINPLFRFYMGYVFPILREIDTGEEHWIRPDRLAEVTQWEMENVKYYTFLPDFMPEVLARGLYGLERKLERTRYNYLSAHFMGVFEKRAE